MQMFPLMESFVPQGFVSMAYRSNQEVLNFLSHPINLSRAFAGESPSGRFPARMFKTNKLSVRKVSTFYELHITGLNENKKYAEVKENFFTAQKMLVLFCPVA